MPSRTLRPFTSALPFQVKPVVLLLKRATRTGLPALRPFDCATTSTVTLLVIPARRAKSTRTPLPDGRAATEAKPLFAAHTVAPPPPASLTGGVQVRPGLHQSVRFSARK